MIKIVRHFRTRLRAYLIYNLLGLTNSLFTLIVAPITLKLIGIENLGLIGLLAGYSLVYQNLIDFGTYTFLTSVVSRDNNAKDIASIYTLKLVLIFLVTPIMALLFIYKSHNFNADFYIMSLFVMATVIFSPFHWEWYFVGRQSFAFPIVARIAGIIAFVTTYILWVIYLKQVKYFLLPGLISAMVSTLILIPIFCNKNIMVFEGVSVKSLLVFFRNKILPLGVASLTLPIIIYGINFILERKRVDLLLVGAFVMSQKITIFWHTILNPISIYLIPKLRNGWKMNFKKSFLISVLLFLCVMATGAGYIYYQTHNLENRSKVIPPALFSLVFLSLGVVVNSVKIPLYSKLLIEEKYYLIGISFLIAIIPYIVVYFLNFNLSFNKIVILTIMPELVVYILFLSNRKIESVLNRLFG